MNKMFSELSNEAQETAKGMIEFCIENGYCMGMDEGLTFKDDEGSSINGVQPFRAELEEFCGRVSDEG